MKTEQQYFNEAISIQQYMENMTTLKEESFRIYDGFEVPTNDGFIALLKEKQPKILTITEDWCGDAMLNNPIIRRIAEAAGLDMRTVFRDADTELIDRYLTNGGRAIPIYLLLDDAGEVIGKWGPRAPELQEFVVTKRASLPDKEDPTFEEAQKALYAEIREENISNQTYWIYVYEDFKKQVTEALQK
ncbi:thioredoxin family protein [Lysinibacillus sp. OL1_EC]|uniref:thioredoxin family protein n=1 Tax=unclassified Lysinibacillus TaxID=2636778 RepID=UPI0010388D47|nr:MULTISPECIES: thioredoxin family protein [unclassified Lysinibacillus]MCM0626626.1 thioredoxin family protein [Lysinibacillus sp. OL1_EC]MCS5503550.1 thioredoxin family protein [Lysinibacillus sp. A4]TBV85890.1 thioredoxin family protein [Lysinibacillus sp. OL1]UKJ44930.1 thioredoxin family protein [Lysinibacillus sp. ACHW1.5]WGT38349.1 thioredoxin family protein [Lysinibacillus sp. 1 U-2021]